VNTAQLQAQASTPGQDHYFNPQTNQELEAIFDHLATTIGGAAAKANSYAFWAGANSVATNTQAGTNYVNQKLYPTGGEEAVLHEYVFSNGVQATFTEIYNKADGSEATAFVSASALSRIASVTIQGPPAAPFLVQAKGLQASAGSHATPQSASASTVGSYMESVSINSIPIQGTVPPNTNISLGGNSFVVLNEQFTSAGSSSSLARANSLHLYVELAAGETFELIVSHADVATVCMDEEEPPGECVPSATNPCCDISSTKGLLAQATECVECDLSAKGCVECPPPTTLADPCNPCPGIRIGSPTEISISPQDCVPECPPELIECGSPCDNVSTCEVVCAFVSATGERVRDIHPTVGNAVAKLDCRLIEQISAN
ncbi:MAG: choice-of-anchor P family protein, partial [Thermoplasmatota archaeon]